MLSFSQPCFAMAAQTSPGPKAAVAAVSSLPGEVLCVVAAAAVPGRLMTATKLTERKRKGTTAPAKDS